MKTKDAIYLLRDSKKIYRDGFTIVITKMFINNVFELDIKSFRFAAKVKFKSLELRNRFYESEEEIDNYLLLNRSYQVLKNLQE